MIDEQQISMEELEEPQCNCHMNKDFTCPHCGGRMIDIEGHYVCEDCEFID